MAKKDILYCDDQQRFIDTFRKNHSDLYDIREETNICVLMDRIEERKPDLVLIDLYHPKDVNEGFEAKRLIAEKELAKLNAQIKIAKDAVEDTWEPIGLRVLQEIRKKYSTLPAIIYSQQGFLFLNDEQVKSVTKSDGHWMLKGAYSSNTEKVIMDSVIKESMEQNNLLDEKAEANENKTNNKIKAYKIFSIVSWFITILVLLTTFLSLTIVWNIVLTVVLGGILPVVILKFVDK